MMHLKRFRIYENASNEDVMNHARKFIPELDEIVQTIKDMHKDLSDDLSDVDQDDMIFEIHYQNKKGEKWPFYDLMKGEVLSGYSYSDFFTSKNIIVSCQFFGTYGPDGKSKLIKNEIIQMILQMENRLAISGDIESNHSIGVVWSYAPQKRPIGGGAR